MRGMRMRPRFRPRGRTRRLRWARVLLALVVCLGCAAFVGCATPPATAPSVADKRDPAELYVRALRHEAENPLDARAYLAVVDRVLLSPREAFGLAALTGALDALIRREVKGLGGVAHAIVHRDNLALKETSQRLRSAYASRLGTPLMRGLIADALHDLALRVGAEKAAAKWRKRAGCVPRAAVAGPLGWPGLTALEQASPLGATDPLPSDFPGEEPFATRAAFDTAIADACAIPINETSALMGMRLVVVDIENPREQDLYVALSGSNASVLEIGGVHVLTRPFSAGGQWATRFARVRAGAGRVRLSVRVAYRHDGSRLAVQLWDEHGQALRTIVPRKGDRGTAKVTRASELLLAPEVAPSELAKGSLELLTAVGGWLAVGEARHAVNLLEAVGTDVAGVELDLLRVRALGAAKHIPRNQRRMQVSPAAARSLTRCASCWEARIYDAAAEEDRKGFGTGVYAAFAKLGVTAASDAWTRELGAMELSYVALQADAADLGDIARAAYDGLARKTPGSMMLADLDGRLYQRHGSARVKAACDGGTNRASTRCLKAHIARSDLRSSLAELRRLRSLRGSRAILRNLEIAQLLDHGKNDEAMLIYDALPVASRSLSLLGLYVGTPDAAVARRRFLQDMRFARDIPHSYEPLARLLGAFEDPSLALEREGAALVAQDRNQAFLPGAGTAVLRHLEHYHLQASGLLHHWTYDLRRVSGTIDVASGTWMGAPRVEGRHSRRILRRRVYKKDGRVIDTDPSARGSQGNTDLVQLQAGDYVEALVMGWALPGDSGQLTVDTPDMLPPRTSVRAGRLTFRRPKSLSLSVWAHTALGKGSDKVAGDDVVTTWKLSNRSPRRLPRGVPPLEARVAISFGTNSYARIARALAAHHLTLDENDPYLTKWVAEAVSGEMDTRKRIARVVAAVGKALKRGDPGALSDWAASLAGDAQNETARMMLERGVGSRTWLVHRALRELGVASDIAVAESRPFTAAPGFPPHTGRFTHPLVRARLAAEVLWIDSDVEGPPLPPGRVSPELRGRQALLVDGTMVTVDVATSVDIDEVTIALDLGSPAGNTAPGNTAPGNHAATGYNASGTVAIKLHGRPAQRLVEAFEVVVGSRRDQLLRGVVLAWVPWADVQEVALASDESSWEVRITARVEMVGFARPEERGRQRYAIPGMVALHTVIPASSATLGARYVQQGERKTALAIDTPLLYRVTRTVRLPAAAKVVALAKSMQVDQPYLRGGRKVAHEGNVITDVFEMNLPVGTIPVATFDTFAKAVQVLDDGFLHTTRVEFSPAQRAK